MAVFAVLGEMHGELYHYEKCGFADAIFSFESVPCVVAYRETFEIAVGQKIGKPDRT